MKLDPLNDNAFDESAERVTSTAIVYRISTYLDTTENFYSDIPRSFRRADRERNRMHRCIGKRRDAHSVQCIVPWAGKDQMSMANDRASLGIRSFRRT